MTRYKLYLIDCVFLKIVGRAHD